MLRTFVNPHHKWTEKDHLISANSVVRTQLSAGTRFKKNLGNVGRPGPLRQKGEDD